ncbi:MAG: hypothetical protein ACQSGP_19825 [Frankia sp.]
MDEQNIQVKAPAEVPAPPQIITDGELAACVGGDNQPFGNSSGSSPIHQG